MNRRRQDSLRLFTLRKNETINYPREKGREDQSGLW